MQKALVMRSTGSWYDLYDEVNKRYYKGRLKGKLKLKDAKVTNPVAVGDYVNIEIEDTQDGFVQITDILERQNYIVRKSTHNQHKGHVIAANIDQAVIIATMAMPRTSAGFIDRFLVSADSHQIPCIVLFNKKDILSEEGLEIQEEMVNIYKNIGYQSFAISALDMADIEKINQLFKGKKTLLSGHSGVGKSTLLNQLCPEAAQVTSEISDYSSKGVHTTTYAEMFSLGDKTYLIDTPGIKELGLSEVEEHLSHFFPEMRAKFGKCKYYNCTHTNEPQCAVIQSVKNGEIAPSRYHSYISMLENEDNRR